MLLVVCLTVCQRRVQTGSEYGVALCLNCGIGNHCLQYLPLKQKHRISNKGTKTSVLNIEEAQHDCCKEFEPDVLNTFCATRV